MEKLINTKIHNVRTNGINGLKVALPKDSGLKVGDELYCFMDNIGNVIYKPYENLTEFEKGQVSK